MPTTKSEQREAKGDEMAEWVHTFKGAVLASRYYVASHMNSRMYVLRFDQATWFQQYVTEPVEGNTPPPPPPERLRIAYP